MACFFPLLSSLHRLVKKISVCFPGLNFFFPNLLKAVEKVILDEDCCFCYGHQDMY